MAGSPIRPIQNGLASPTPLPRTTSRHISIVNMALPTPPRALLFDVFGTCVNWRKSVVHELHAQAHAALNSASASLASRVRMKVSEMTTEHWGLFAQQWRDTYKTFTKSLAADPSIPWVSVDEHYLASLKKLMGDWEIEGLWIDEELRTISLIWHRLEPWEDSAKGVELLNQLFCTFSCQCASPDPADKKIRYMHTLKWKPQPSCRSPQSQQDSLHASLLCRGLWYIQAGPACVPWRC